MSDALLLPQPAPTVHVLKYGQALCGIVGMPRDWPDGNVWVAFDDRELIKKASCRTCLERV